MGDIGMATFAMFFMQCESFLEFQRQLQTRMHRSNLHTLFGVQKIPTDPHIRSMLDKVEPESLQRSFDDVIQTLVSDDGLDGFTCLDSRILVALDGTEYFCSQKLSCEHCLERKRRNGTVEYYHCMLAATIVAPGKPYCVHLMPEFIETPDGTDKQDCERNAAKRFLTSEKTTSVLALRPVFLGDALFACQPVAQKVAGIDGADFIFVVKPEYHKAVFDFVGTASPQTLVVSGSKAATYTYRWVRGVPLRKDTDDDRQLV